MPTWNIGKGLLHIRQGDLTRSETDAIVNAANSRLAGGGGVDGAVHRAAGPGLPEACRDIITRIGSLPPGEAVITSGFNLAARYVIHTVGPIWRGGDHGEEEFLRSAYGKSLEIGAANAVRTIAFPAVSCGVYGYPVESAGPVALQELRNGLEKGLAGEVGMVLHSSDAYELWTRIGREILGDPS